ERMPDARRARGNGVRRMARVVRAGGNGCTGTARSPGSLAARTGRDDVAGSVREQRTGKEQVLDLQARVMLAAAVVAGALAGILSALGAGAVLIFGVSAVALALLAALVGQATDQLGSRLGPGATGVLQSALGNLPELFVAVFAL